MWDDLKAPVRDAGEGNQLNTFPELSVAFWRWAIWKLFEAQNAPQRGVIAFITNRKFLTGWPYAGLRQMMRQRFDRIEIFDLRGDVRAGERAGVEHDQGVFNIQVGTAITLAIADGSKREGEAADVFYHDAWAEGLFGRRQKLERFRDRAADGTMPNPVLVQRGWLDDMRPAPFQSGEWVSLQECFIFTSSGLESKRDQVVYAVSRAQLTQQVDRVLRSNGEVLNEYFNSTDMNPAADAQNSGWDESRLRLAGYRPFDLRWHYGHPRWNDRPRPKFEAVWGGDNCCLFSLPRGTNAGPAVWCYANYPDRHAFRGSYGGYAFPLYDRRPGSAGSNLNPTLIAGLAAAYGRAIVPEAVFDYLLAFLTARDYALRFAEDLEDTFPHAAFPADHALFADGAALGGEIRALESFARPPQDMPADFVRLDTRPSGSVARNEPEGETLALCADGSGLVGGLPQPVWRYAVSGYRLLPRWLEARAGQPADLTFFNAFRDICGRISELIDRQAEADRIMHDVLQEPLSREALGLDI